MKSHKVHFSPNILTLASLALKGKGLTINGGPKPKACRGFV